MDRRVYKEKPLSKSMESTKPPMEALAEQRTDDEKIIDLTRLIDHITDCMRDLASGVGVSKNVIIGSAEDHTSEW